MPGNIIEINGAKELTWYVGDSQMEDLIKYLDIHRSRETTTAEEKTVNIPKGVVYDDQRNER